jgi:hypothetical protein
MGMPVIISFNRSQRKYKEPGLLLQMTMATVKIRTNMIIDGKFHRFGSLLGESAIPPKYKKRKYIVHPGEIDPDEENLRHQEKAAERA